MKKRSTLWVWLLFALVAQVAFQQQGGTNARSRGATLLALVEEGSFQIDRYLSLTVDWAQTPDGHFYSNKAPGPVFLALPFFWVVDQVQTWGVADRQQRDVIREQSINGNLRFLSLLLQLLPWLLVVGLWYRELENLKVSSTTRIIFLCAVLFANTSAVFMNTFFGHGLAAIWMLLLFWAVWKQRFALAGFCFGWAALCDYGATVYAVPLAVLAMRAGLRRHSLVTDCARIAAGAALPAVLWVSYHGAIFGGPLSLPYRYQNPIFVDMAHQSVQLWGVLGLPSPAILVQLLFGTFRGMLWTQPWVMLLIAVLVVVRAGKATAPLARDLVQAILTGFLLLLLMNASFGGWHGGASPGPRYLAPGLALFAIALALRADEFTKNLRFAFTVLVGIGAVFALVALSVYELPREDMTLGGFYFDRLTGEHWKTPALRLAISLPWLAWLLFPAFKGTSGQSAQG